MFLHCCTVGIVIRCCMFIVFKVYIASFRLSRVFKLVVLQEQLRRYFSIPLANPWRWCDPKPKHNEEQNCLHCRYDQNQQKWIKDTIATLVCVALLLGRNLFLSLTLTRFALPFCAAYNSAVHPFLLIAWMHSGYLLTYKKKIYTMAMRNWHFALLNQSITSSWLNMAAIISTVIPSLSWWHAWLVVQASTQQTPTYNRYHFLFMTQL